MKDGFLPFAEKKCWGKVWHIFQSTEAAVSCLEVKRGWMCSCHRHEDRVNMFAVLSGKILIEWWEYDFEARHQVTLHAGDTTYIEPDIYHRFCVLEDGIVVEVYWSGTGGPVRFDDIHRVDEGGEYNVEKGEPL